MSTPKKPAKPAPVKPAGSRPEVKKAEDKREKRTITEIRESKRTGEKVVYMSVPDYTSAQWAEMAGVDVAVLGDSLAMIAHGHRNTVPATMDMMVMHGQAVRRGAPNTFMLGCMPYQSYNTVDRALVNATRFMQESLCDAVKPQGGKSQAHILRALVDAGIPTASHIGLTPHTVAMFGGFKIQGRTADAAMKILEDALAIEDAGCFMLEFEAVPAKIARLIRNSCTIPTIGIGAGAGCDRADPAVLRSARRVHRFQAEIHQALRQIDRSSRQRNHAICKRGEGRHVPGRRPFLYGERGRIRKICRTVARNERRSNMGRLPATALRQPRSGVRQSATLKGGRRVLRAMLTEQAYRLIEEQIVTLRLKPGDILSEQMLARHVHGLRPSAKACSGWRAKA